MYVGLMMRGLDTIPSNIKRFSCVLIGNIFYGMVQNAIYIVYDIESAAYGVLFTSEVRVSEGF